MGLDYKSLKGTHPSLIVCDISGYGSTGPYRNKKAYDLLIQAEAGFLSITASPGQPAKSGISIADIAAATTAFQNILAAILQRSQNGGRGGCRLDVRETESLLEKLQENGIANSRLRDLEGVWEHPQLEARERWVEVETENGMIPTLKPAGAPDGCEALGYL
ncbi:uncharacterized protein MYCFIDRAFT_216620 [Pseudocercospora fijiensis CIRAD86]|uniref:CoA-transferase family III n=1 Tax=Pseudocercospora fijiensis (strain CIRAD86) TaxID=383855 RepID=M2YKW4_PSEFD|nr:uncharacterized protein MYCFIDRAFT_216620 [Pseudocercospora fijiensis CIRAD86]EME78370.1 hypothetical protein MYCFIDRAFT_216620 [Pseudocercospora fijiensis CIRAD86]